MSSRTGSAALLWSLYVSQGGLHCVPGSSLYSEGKEAKCLATSLRRQDNSLPVVLENYSSQGVLQAGLC